MLTDAEKRKLTPADLLLAERAEEREQRGREQDRENYADECALAEALETNPDLDPDRAVIRGKRVNGRSTTYRHAANIQKDADYAALLLGGAAGLSLQEIYERYQSLVFLFHEAQNLAAGPSATAKASTQLVQTDDHIFDTAHVSLKTLTALESEASVINTRVLALASIREPGARKVEMENISREAERLNMVQHPETKLYVHSEARVVTLEIINNPHADAKLCTHAICVFRPRMPSGVDSLGIHRKGLGDVYNNDVAEIIVTGQHIAPELKHS